MTDAAMPMSDWLASLVPSIPDVVEVYDPFLNEWVLLVPSESKTLINISSGEDAFV